MKPGIHFNLRDRAYRDLPFLNWSRLRHVLTAPAKAKFVSDMGPTVVTEPMKHGTRVHLAVLEADKWNLTYRVRPDIDKQELVYAKEKDGWWIGHCNGRKGPYKTKGEAQADAPLYIFKGCTSEGWPRVIDAKNAMAERFKGLQLITKDQHSKAMDVAEAVYNHPASADLLFSKLHTEMSFVWVEEIDGHEVLCKGRADGYSRTEKLLFDLKTCPSSDLRKFRYKALDWKYHAQLAFYARGIVKAAQQSGESFEVDRLAIIAVEHDPPHLVSFLELGPRMQAQGEELVQTALEIWSECEVSGRWPGRSPDPVMMELYG